MKIYTDETGIEVLDISEEVLTLHDPKRRAALIEQKSNIDESSLGLSNADAVLLKEIETNGANLSDVTYQQFKLEILRLERQGLVNRLETSGGSGAQGVTTAGYNTRTFKLTPKGRLMMLIGSMQTSGPLKRT